MKQIFLFLALSYFSMLYACATCMLMTPTVEVSLHVNEDVGKLNQIDVEWKFSDIYTEELMLQFDKNRNKKFDESELKEILNIKLDYFKPRNFLMKTTLIHNENEEAIPLRFENPQIEIRDSMLYFTFNAITDYPVFKKDILKFVCEDEENYFSFVVKEFKLVSKHLKAIHNLYLHVATIEIVDASNETSSLEKESLPKTTTSKKLATPEKELSQKETFLEQSIAKLKSLLKDIKEGSSTLSYFMLLLFAYVYGIVHAMGPGHGKTLVSSYFLSHERSYSKALRVSAMIGVVHTFSAFILTLVVYYVITNFLAQVLDNAVFYTTKISAIIIIIIAIHLFIKKFQADKKRKLHSNNFVFSTTAHESSCGCNACKVDNQADLALIFSAGIIPCPGTVTLFIFAFSLELYTVGIFSALLMSLGMSTIIFLSAIISVTIRKKGLTERPRLKRILEYLSLTIIFVLGLALLLF